MRQRLDRDLLLARPFGAAVTALALAALTAVLAPLLGDSQVVIASLSYLLVTLLAAAIWGYEVGIVAALASDLLVNFFYVPPLYTLTVQKPENVAALFVFLAVAVTGASMLSLLRRQVRVAQAHRRETEVVLGIVQAVAHAGSHRLAMEALCASATRALQARGVAIVTAVGNEWVLAAASGAVGSLSREELVLVAEADRTGDVVGVGSRRTRPAGRARIDDSRRAVVVPFRRRPGPRGALVILGTLRAAPLVDVDDLLRTFADEASLAVQRGQLAEAAREADDLRRADELKTALLSSVSHDLRSPLTAIKAAVGSLRDTEISWSEDDRTAMLATVESQTDRLTATVTNLLEMSRLEGGVVRPRLEAVEVVPLLHEVDAATATVTAGRAVETDAPPGLWINADYGLLLQALVNLVDNAAKYSTPGRAITLRARASAATVEIAVADEGPGIPPGDLPHLFEKFYRGEQAGKGRGTGLGLSIVRAMVQLCGGQVSVESAPGGTTFTLALRPALAPAVRPR